MSAPKSSTTAVPVEPAEIGDVFSDPSKLRVGQEYLVTGAVKKVILKIPVGKPDQQEFLRVRSGGQLTLSSG
jgi:hypothetical protein